MKYIEIWGEKDSWSGRDKTLARLLDKIPPNPKKIFRIGEDGDFKDVIAFIDFYMSDPYYHNEKPHVYFGLIDGYTVEIRY